MPASDCMATTISSQQASRWAGESAKVGNGIDDPEGKVRCSLKRARPAFTFATGACVRRLRVRGMAGGLLVRIALVHHLAKQLTGTFEVAHFLVGLARSSLVATSSLAAIGSETGIIGNAGESDGLTTSFHLRRFEAGFRCRFGRWRWLSAIGSRSIALVMSNEDGIGCPRTGRFGQAYVEFQCVRHRRCRYQVPHHSAGACAASAGATAGLGSCFGGARGIEARSKSSPPASAGADSTLISAFEIQANNSIVVGDADLLVTDAQIEAHRHSSVAAVRPQARSAS